MSPTPSELAAALRVLTHDVRASLGVLVPALDELELEREAGQQQSGGSANTIGRARELTGMMRRACRRLEVLAEASELALALGAEAPQAARLDLVPLVRETVTARVVADRAVPVPVEFSLPPRSLGAGVASWLQYVVGEVVSFAVKRARARLSVALHEEPDAWELLVASDAPSRVVPVGPPFSHPLGLASVLVDRCGGALALMPGELVAVRLRVPRDRHEDSRETGEPRARLGGG